MQAKRIIQGCALLMIAGSMMGNTSCQQQTVAQRQLRRRVQMGNVTAFPMTLPSGGTFDFGAVANAEMDTVLQSTSYFSTATVTSGSSYNLSGLSADEAAQFNQCQDDSTISSSASAAKVAKSASGVKILATGVTNQAAACMIDIPQGVINGSILDFSLTSSTGVNLSFTQLTSALSLGATFNYSKSTLDLTMEATDPLIAGDASNGHMSIAAAMDDSYQSTTSGSLNLNFAIFGAGVSGFQQDPLAQVVNSGLTKAITDLGTSWNASTPWYAMVMKSCDQYIYINAGGASDANLQVGDIVRIEAVDYTWSGAACNSQLTGTVPIAGNPVVAYAQITSVGDTMSIAQVYKNNANYPYSTTLMIQPGNRVYMETMASSTTSSSSSSSSGQ